MAHGRHRRHRRSSLAGFALNGLPVRLGDSVKVQDVVLGAAAGLAVTTLVKGLLNKFAGAAWASAKQSLGPAVPVVTAFASAAALYYAQKGSARAKGHAVGAVTAGVAVTVLALLPKLQTMLPAAAQPYFDFSDVVGINLNGLGNYGYLVEDQPNRAYAGLLVSDKSDALNELAAYSMGDTDDDGLNSLVG
jgi:hypothetical protein